MGLRDCLECIPHHSHHVPENSPSQRSAPSPAIFPSSSSRHLPRLPCDSSQSRFPCRIRLRLRGYVGMGRTRYLNAVWRKTLISTISTLSTRSEQTLGGRRDESSRARTGTQRLRISLQPKLVTLQQVEAADRLHIARLGLVFPDQTSRQLCTPMCAPCCIVGLNHQHPLMT